MKYDNINHDLAFIYFLLKFRVFFRYFGYDGFADGFLNIVNIDYDRFPFNFSPTLIV